MSPNYKREVVFLVFLVLFLLGSLSAVTYLNSSDMFIASVFHVNNEKTPYYVIINLENKIEGSIDYEIEVLYGKQNLVVGEESISCPGKCEVKINLKKIFFDKYDIIVRAKHDNNYYEKKLDFKLEKPQSNLNIIVNKIKYNASSNLFVNGTLFQNTENKEKYLFEIFPKEQEDLKQKFDFECRQKVCDFNFEINSSILLGEYVLRVYSSKEAIDKSFVVSIFNETQEMGDGRREKGVGSWEMEDERSKNMIDSDDENVLTVFDINTKISEIKRKKGDLTNEIQYVKNKGDVKDHSNIIREGKDEIKLDTEIETLAKFEDSGKNIKIKKIKQRDNDNEKVDFEFELEGNSLNLNGINSSRLKKLDVKKNKEFGTDILFAEVENNSFDSSQIVLEKTSGYVDKILVCNNYSQISVDLGYTKDELAILNSKVYEDEINNATQIEYNVPVALTGNCPYGWLDSGINFEQNLTHVWFNTTHFSAYTGSLTIFNPQSYPVVNGIWTVEFTTNGTADLWIYASNGTTWSNNEEIYDLKFLRLMCGNTLVEYQYIDGKVFVPNYFCQDKSYSTVKVLTGGVHVQTYQFGETIAYAKNFATERGSGFLAYMDTTNPTIPKYRVFDPVTMTWSSELNATSVVNNIEEIQVACSVARHECALLTVDSLDDVKVQFYNGKCWNNGTTCGQIKNLSLSAGTTSGQRAQMMYEAISGDLLLVWSGNGADLINYTIWNGSDFSTTANVLSGTLITTGTPIWFEMAQEPNTNNISIIYKTNTPQVGIFSYSGDSNSFGCEIGAAITGVSAVVRPGIDINFEQISGDMFAVAGDDTTTEFFYRTRPSGSCVYSGTASTVMTDASDSIRIAPVWGTDKIIIHTIADTTNADRSGHAMWNGSAIASSALSDTSVIAGIAGNRLLDVACSRTEDICILPYADNSNANPNALDWYSLVPSTAAWLKESDVSGLSPMWTNSEEAIECTPYPFIADAEIMCIFEDENDDIFAKIYDPIAGSFFDTEGAAALETSSAIIEYKSFSFNFVIFNSPYVPVIINPLNGTTGNQINLNLSVEVSDPNDDIMNVSFYFANNGTLIGTNTNVDSGSITNRQLSNLSYLTNYSWYVIVTDGMYTTTSDVWNFTTKDRIGNIKVIMNTPSTSGEIITVFNNISFKVNVTLVCEGINDESCYNVSAWVQYNNSLSNFLNVSNPSGNPFYTVSSQPMWCVLNASQNCTKEWLVTPNGTVGNISKMKAYVLSNRTTITQNSSLNTTVNISTAPANSVLWATSSVNMGSTNLNLGVLNQIATIRVVNNHTSVNVTCTSGNCSMFTDNFVDNLNYTQSEDPVVTFTCLDNVVGIFAANFSVISNQDSTPAYLQLSCQVNQTYGTLSIVLNSPLANETTIVSRYQTLKVNTTLSCVGTTGSLCGDVSVNARYSVELSLLNWWNLAYPYRKGILINETSGVTRVNDPIIVNMTGLHDITSCLNDTRVIYLDSGINTEIKSQILSGDNSTWCSYVFLGNVSANAVNENRYYVYYGSNNGNPDYISSIVSTNDSLKWDLDNGLISWQYKWTGALGGGPWRSFMTTPSGKKVSSIGSTSGDDGFQNADAFVSFNTTVDGPIYKEYLLKSNLRGNQTMKVYAEQNWYEITNTYTCISGCNDYYIVGIEGVDTSSRSWYDTTSSTATGLRNANKWFFIDGNTPKQWGIGVILSGVDERPFNGTNSTNPQLQFSTGVDGWYVNNDAYVGGFPYWVYTGDNNTIDSNNTYFEVRDPINLNRTGSGTEQSFYYTIISTTPGTIPMYTNGSQPLTCSALTQGNSCNLVWDIFPVKSGAYYININSSSSLVGAGKFSSNNSLVNFVWPEVYLQTPINNSASNKSTNFYFANFTSLTANLTGATLFVWNETGSLIGTNTTSVTGQVNSSNLSLITLVDGLYYWNYNISDVNGYTFADYNFTFYVDTNAPIVNLTLPNNDTPSNVSTNFFSANLTDNVKLTNATLYIWNASGSLIGTNTTNISGITNSTNLSYTFLAEGTYYWNYLAYDIASNANFSITNRTIFIDFSPPIITFVSPTDGNNSYVNRSSTYINTTIYDLSFNQSYVQWNNSLNSTLNCSLISNSTYNCFINKTSLLNGLYSYKVCANDSFNNGNCTVDMLININLTLPIINITSPVNGTKVNYNESVLFNITTSIPVNASWYELDNNGTFFNMSNTSTLNWNGSISNLTGGYHLVKIYANDSVGNVVSASAYFYIVYQMDIYVDKSVRFLGNNSYSVLLNITNFGKYPYYYVHDFVNLNFVYYNLSVSSLNFSNISGTEYSGNISVWNLTLPSLTSTTISYNINGTGDYNMSSNFMVGSE